MSSILVLDDDAIFREMVSNLLEQRGYNVIQACSVKEASEAFSRHMPQLAIVDYRMPESDGMTWIGKLRETRSDTLIVFVSALGCDERTFNWLRNILKVSLIVQKPIVPHDFMSQIEELLPVDADATATSLPACASARTTVENECAQIISRFQDSEMAKVRTQAILESLDTEAARLRQLTQLRKKLEVELAIKSIKAEYPRELASHWRELTEKIGVLRDLPLPQGDQLRVEVVDLAHKIRGTASSLGFRRSGEAARKLELYVGSLNPLGGSSNIDSLWSAIMTSLQEGQNGISKGALPERTPNLTDPVSGKILLVAKLDKLALLTPADMEKLSQLVVVSNPQDAMVQARLREFSGVIIDVEQFGRGAVVELITQLRMSKGNEQLPISAVVTRESRVMGDSSRFSLADRNVVQESVFTDTDLSYYGCSVVIEHPISRQKIETTIRELDVVRQADSPRVLFIDDDEILSRFLATILAGEGLDVHTLYEPVRVMDEIEKIDPDLILLDVSMPGLNGFEVCRMLRLSEHWKNIPIVFLTSKSTPEAAFEVGATDFLRKPVATHELVDCINNQMENTCVTRDQNKRDDLTGALSHGAFRRSAKGMFASTVGSHHIMCLCLLQLEQFADTRSDGGHSQREDLLEKLGMLIQGRFRSDVLRGRWSEMGIALAFVGETKKSVLGVIDMLNQEFELLTFSGNGSSSPESIERGPRLMNGIADAKEKDGTFEDLWKAAHFDLLNR